MAYKHEPSLISIQATWAYNKNLKDPESRSEKVK